MGSSTSHTKKDYQTLRAIEASRKQILDRIDAFVPLTLRDTETSRKQILEGIDAFVTQILDEIRASRVAEQDDLAAIEHHWHSRWRVYPQDVTKSITLIAPQLTNTFGDWTLMIPLNTVPFDFDIIGFVVEEASTTLTTYFIQIGYNTIDAEPGTNMEMGERRFRIAESPIKNANELLPIRSQDIPANASVWGRLKTSSDSTAFIKISVVIDRHVAVEREVPLYPAFPW